jgi:hypothetical protein
MVYNAICLGDVLTPVALILVASVVLYVRIAYGWLPGDA